jgi:hypothetical protein
MMTALKREGEPDYVPFWELIINEPAVNKLHGKIRNKNYASIFGR